MDSSSLVYIANIIIVDSCTLLKLFIKQTKVFHRNDPEPETEQKVLLVLNDIAMLENRKPFTFLKKLYRKIYPDGTEIKDDHRVANIVRKTFFYPLVSTSSGAHILHLIHVFARIKGTKGENQKVKQAKQELVRCAKTLQLVGITILSKPNSKTTPNHLDWFDFDISFNNCGVLEIPTLYVYETTEVKWRNLIAKEQSRFWIQRKYTSYALFFKGLICCENDIKLLEKKGVIVNKSNKSREELLTLFQTMSNGVEHMSSSYTEICEELNVYGGNIVTTGIEKLPIMITWHQWSQEWKFIGVVVAVLLLGLFFAAWSHYLAYIRG